VRFSSAPAGTEVALGAAVRTLLVLCLLVHAASADGYYFTEGVGGADIHDQVGQVLPSAFRVRISVGERTGPWAVEAWFAGLMSNDLLSRTELDTYGVDLKYVQPMSRHLEVYVRGTMSGASGQGALEGMSGRGLGFGAGIAVKGKVSPWGLLWTPLFWLVRTGPKITGSLWLDDGYEFYRLHGDRPYTLDAQVSHITLGFGLGSDF
jgi:hypothetical protein